MDKEKEKIKIQKRYEKGYWTAAMVQMAVRKGVITQEQCDEILNNK